MQYTCWFQRVGRGHIGSADKGSVTMTKAGRMSVLCGYLCHHDEDEDEDEDEDGDEGGILVCIMWLRDLRHTQKQSMHFYIHSASTSYHAGVYQGEVASIDEDDDRCVCNTDSVCIYSIYRYSLDVCDEQFVR